LKKYPSFKKDLASIFAVLTDEPTHGTAIGKSCYKVRVKISAKNKGKSGGGRLITYVHFDGKEIYLFTIYDKSEKENITETELKALLSEIVS
jgi:hypothetical protein